MKSNAQSIDDYINELPEERRPYFKKLRGTILKNIGEGFKEEVNSGMIGYVVPHSIYPEGYHCTPELPLPFVNIANQKNFIALYHMGMYADKVLEEWFIGEYEKTCKYKLDMGKSCIRFKKMEDIPYELIGELVSKMPLKRWIEIYEKVMKK